jgi:hypothetical protein
MISSLGWSFMVLIYHKLFRSQVRERGFEGFRQRLGYDFDVLRVVNNYFVATLAGKARIHSSTF